MKKIKKNAKAIMMTIAMMCAASAGFTGCQMGLNAGITEEMTTEDSSRAASKSEATGWEEFTKDEIDDAKKNCPPKEKKKVEAFEGAMARLFNIGANLVTEDIEDPMLASLAGYGTQIIGAGMQWLDGFLNDYTGGFYKSALAIVWPQEKTPDPAIAKLQDSVDKVQETADEILRNVNNLSEDLKLEFGAEKVTQRIGKIGQMQNSYEEMLSYLGQIDASKDMSYNQFHNLAVSAKNHFGSTEILRTQTMNFFEEFYSTDVAARRNFGQAYKLIGENTFPWRYQSNAFIQQMMMMELEPSVKFFTVCDILLNPCNENFQKDAVLEYIASTDFENANIKLEYVSALNSRNVQRIEEIEALMEKVSATEDFQKVLTSKEAAWEKLVNCFNEYSLTVNKIELPGEDSNAYMTCNVRRMKYTFNSNMSGDGSYSFELKKLCGAQNSYKTEANWKKLYCMGLYDDSARSDCLAVMPNAGQYQELLNFYNSNGFKPTDGKIKWTKGTNGKWYAKKCEGKELPVTLYNIFEYDADLSIENDTGKIACWDKKNPMGFRVDNQTKGDWYKPDGLYTWTVTANYVDANATAVTQKDMKILGEMAAKKDDKTKIYRCKYYDSSYVNDGDITTLGIVANNDAQGNF